MKTKFRCLFSLCMVTLIIVLGGCVNTPISATATFSPTVTVTSTALSQPEETVTITPTAIVPQTESVEPVLPVTLREMQFVPNDSACHSVTLDQIQLDGEILFESVSGSGDTINVGVDGLVNINNLYWNDEMLEAIRASDDGRWTVALFQDRVGYTTFLEATGWVLINNLNGEIFQGSWDLEEEYHYLGWEVYSSDESGVQMLLFPYHASNRDRYLSEIKLFDLPAGEVQDLGLDVDTENVEYYGNFPPAITFSPNRNRVIYYSFSNDNFISIHKLIDVDRNQILWSAPEAMTHGGISGRYWLWAPDQSVLALPLNHSLQKQELLQADLFLLGSDAESLEKVTQFRKLIDAEFMVKPLSWSEDSQKLLVVVDEWVEGGGENRYYVMDFEHNQIIQSCLFQWSHTTGGLWYADGTRVIFEMGDREHGYSLVEMDASNGDANIAETVYDDLELLHWYQE